MEYKVQKCEDPDCPCYGQELVDRGYGYPVCPDSPIKGMIRKQHPNQVGPGCYIYKCRICGVIVCDTTGSNEAGTLLCLACYDASTIENEHLDGYHDSTPNPTCPLCTKDGQNRRLEE